MKLFVTQVSNGNMSTVSEWNNNPKGAKVSFHNTAKTLWNEVAVIEAELKILDEQMNTFEGYAEHITHAKVEGYLSDGKFYADEEHTQEIVGRNDTLYVDITDPDHPANYKWNGSAFVAA